jgi:hypothetical protein
MQAVFVFGARANRSATLEVVLHFAVFATSTVPQLRSAVADRDDRHRELLSRRLPRDQIKVGRAVTP